MRLPAAFLFLLVPLGAALAQSAPRSIGDCERVKGDMAYNNCLATFGPKANVRAAADGATAPAASAAPEAEARGAAAAARPAYGRRGRGGRYAGRGRSRAAFTVGPAGRTSYRRSRRR